MKVKKQTFSNLKLTVICLMTLVLIISCNKSISNLAVNNVVDSTKIGKIKTVLILGNSIAWHPPEADIGWTGDWGMAASSRDSDFVHILIHDLLQKDSSVSVEFKNISDFEKNFVSYPFSNLDSLRNPDLLIMRIAENVDDKKAKRDNFIAYYDSLINYLDPNKKAVKILVDGFWENQRVNEDIKEYAINKNYPFITITDLSGNPTNEAINLFSNPHVAVHPSDRGMRLIAERIWNYMKNYFN
jgi:hypothetical protein